MKLQRQLMIIFYLINNASATITELSNFLEVSRRTICRDIEMLRTSGVEIESSVGKTGGYSLSSDFSFDKFIFSSCELSMILLSTKFLKQFAGTEFAKEANELSNKIEKLLNSSTRSPLSTSKFLLIDTRPENQLDNTNTILRYVENAYDNQMLLYINYKSPMCNKLSTAGNVAPYGLVNEAGFWYIVGYCFEHQVYRAFHVAFICDIHVTQEPFTQDPLFNLDDFWASTKT